MSSLFYIMRYAYRWTLLIDRYCAYLQFCEDALQWEKKKTEKDFRFIIGVAMQCTCSNSKTVSQFIDSNTLYDKVTNVTTYQYVTYRFVCCSFHKFKTLKKCYNFINSYIFMLKLTIKIKSQTLKQFVTLDYNPGL